MTASYNCDDPVSMLGIRMSPTRTRLGAMNALLAALKTSLSPIDSRNVATCIKMGAYTGAIEIASAALAERDKDPKLAQLVDQLRAAALQAIEERLGSFQHTVVWSSRMAAVNDQLREIANIAAAPVPITTLVRLKANSDPVRTTELVLQLVHHGVLKLGRSR